MQRQTDAHPEGAHSENFGNSKELSLGVEPGDGLKGRIRGSLCGSKVPGPSAHGLRGAIEDRKHRELRGGDEVGGVEWKKWQRTTLEGGGGGGKRGGGGMRGEKGGREGRGGQGEGHGVHGSVGGGDLTWGSGKEGLKAKGSRLQAGLNRSCIPSQLLERLQGPKSLEPSPQNSGTP